MRAIARAQNAQRQAKSLQAKLAQMLKMKMEAEKVPETDPRALLIAEMERQKRAVEAVQRRNEELALIEQLEAQRDETDARIKLD